jgi:hypothetical protein
MNTTNHTTKKELSKINLEIKKVLNSINDYTESEINDRFNTREGYIIANIKVYDYLSESDILNTIKDYPNIIGSNEFAISTKFAILEEFNDERLNNVFHHVCESKVAYLKEKYEGNCDLTNFTKVFHVYNYTKRYETKEKAIEENIENDWYIKTYFDKAKKYKTFEAYKKAIKKENESEFNDFVNRDSINFKCWQFGRSGGWFSICKKEDYEQDWLYYYISYQAHDLLSENDNNTFNEIVNDLLNCNESKKQFLSRLKENLKDIEFKFNAVESVINDIEESKKYFKDCLISQLNHEINSFLEEYEEEETLSNVTIQIDNNKILTSKGVTVLLSEFKANLIELMANIKGAQLEENSILPIKKNVGNYFVEYAKKVNNDFIIKAGCHKFSLNNILNTVSI